MIFIYINSISKVFNIGVDTIDNPLIDTAGGTFRFPPNHKKRWNISCSSSPSFEEGMGRATCDLFGLIRVMLVELDHGAVSGS